MRDRLTGNNVRVHTEGTGGPYIAIEPNETGRVEKALKEAGISFSTDPNAIRLDGKSAATVFNFGKGADVKAIQHVLDSLLTFEEYGIPPKHRATVDGFEGAVQASCGGLAISEIEVTVEKDENGRDLIVFTLHDALGNGIARVECAPDEAPREIGRRATRTAGKMIHTSGA